MRNILKKCLSSVFVMGIFGILSAVLSWLDNKSSIINIAKHLCLVFSCASGCLYCIFVIKAIKTRKNKLRGEKHSC